MNDFMKNLTHNFDERFREFNLPVNIMMFRRDPFTITYEDDFIEIANSYYQQLKKVHYNLK